MIVKKTSGEGLGNSAVQIYLLRAGETRITSELSDLASILWNLEVWITDIVLSPAVIPRRTSQIDP